MFSGRKGSCAASEGSIEGYPYANENDGDEEGEDGDNGHHPHFDRAIMRSRRKSVSFAVCKMNAETMQFEIENKSVLLGNMSASANSGIIASASTPAVPGSNPGAVKKSSQPTSPLKQVAKRWRDAKKKLVLKDAVANAFLGAAGKNKDLEFPEETFRNRRKELIEKAKALEDAQAAKSSRSKRKSSREEPPFSPKDSGSNPTSSKDSGFVKTESETAI